MLFTWRDKMAKKLDSKDTILGEPREDFEKRHNLTPVKESGKWRLILVLIGSIILFLFSFLS